MFPFVAAYALTSIQVQNSLIQLGKTDVDIRCLVNDSENERIIGIQLIRSNTNIVSVTETGVRWQDQELQQRAVADGSVMNATSSYLHMTIVRQNVTKNDSGTYSCKSSNKYGITQDSQKAYLNITGNYISYRQFSAIERQLFSVMQGEGKHFSLNESVHLFLRVETKGR